MKPTLPTMIKGGRDSAPVPPVHKVNAAACREFDRTILKRAIAERQAA